MGNQRIFLWALLALTLWLCYEAWQKDYAQPAPPPATSQTTPGQQAPAEAGLDSVPTMPSPSAAPDAPAASAAAATPEIPGINGGSQGTVRVLTDVLDMDIGLAGGTLRRADLLVYPKAKDRPEDVVRLFESATPHPYVFQSGLTSADEGGQPDHTAVFTAPAQEYRLAQGQDELKIPLTWTNGQGLTVVKTFTFRRGQYGVTVDYDIDNQTGADWHAASYMQFLRTQEHQDRSMWDVESYAFRGPAVHDGEAYHKLDIEDEEESKYSRSVTSGWIASMQHHFVAAAVPTEGQAYQFDLKVKDHTYVLSAVGSPQAVPAGQQKRITENVFVGPKLQAQLEELSPELHRTADYGMLTIISKPLFIVLDWVHGVVGNWGWSIVIVTLLLKLLFYPLSETSGRSMAKMRMLAPRIKNLQERYKDNREQLGRAMMDIYKREKINPMAGCLPMLVQIPVFLAFYWVLLESVEMRQAPFMLWINDLSSKDPFFVLPILMGAAMFAQFKLNPAPPDPLQAKIFMIMPIAMTVMFAFFPSGLVLYWLTNTLLSILQQWNINRRIEAGKKVPA